MLAITSYLSKYVIKVFKNLLIHIHSTRSVVFAILGCLILFEASHFNIFVLSVLFPVIMMVDAFPPALLVMSIDPRNHVMFGAGEAFLLTTQVTSIEVPSIIFIVLLLGIKVILWTSTKNKIHFIGYYFISKYFFSAFTTGTCIASIQP